jgi:hypothetical protein
VQVATALESSASDATLYDIAPHYCYRPWQRTALKHLHLCIERHLCWKAKYSAQVSLLTTKVQFDHGTWRQPIVLPQLKRLLLCLGAGAVTDPVPLVPPVGTPGT